MIGIAKTVKLFIGGSFPRTESGRTFKTFYHKTDKVYAHLCKSSRKDFRTTVEAAEEGFHQWASRSAFNRSQILYRMAEMAEGKRLEFVSLFQMTLGMNEQNANKEVDNAIDAFVYYAGFCDKHMQLLSNLNPINGPYANSTAPDPMGVVTLFAENKLNFGRFISQICAILCGGNSIVVLIDEANDCPAILAPLAEVFATSDLPNGVVNILTGSFNEIIQFVGSHMAVRSISVQENNSELIYKIKELAVGNLKRVILPRTNVKCLEAIQDTLEFKTIWQPMGF